MKVTSSPCVLCSATQRSVLFVLTMGRVVQCEDCALVSMVGIEDGELVRCDYDHSYFYPDAGKTVGYPDYFGRERTLRSRVAGCFAAAVETQVDGLQRSLDVGCGGGYLVAALRRRGIDAIGVDPAEAVLNGADQALRPWLFHGALDAPEIVERAPFDLVTMMDVIEHIADPVVFLAAATRLLRPGGVLLLLTPRFGGRLSTSTNDTYVHFNRDHMYYFDEGSLHRTIVKATGKSPTIHGALEFWQRNRVNVPDDVRAKYTLERDSMVAMCRRPATADPSATDQSGRRRAA